MSAEPDPTQITDVSLIYLVGRIDQAIRRELRQRLAHFKLTVTEFTALSVLARRPGLSNAQLARRALVRPQSMIQVLAELEHRGLVARTVDPGHGPDPPRRADPGGRARSVRETEPGVVAVQDLLFGDLDDATRATVQSALWETMTRLRSLSEADRD